MAVDQKERTFETIHKQIEAFALDASNQPIRFRETQRMKRSNNGRLPNDEYVSHCLASKNYRMLFAYMNKYGYDHIGFDIMMQIPLFDVLTVFPQGCFSHIQFFERPNITSFDFLISYCWLCGKISDIIHAFFKAVLYMKIDFNIISKMTDLKQESLEVIEEILKNEVYRDVIINQYMYFYDDSRFLGKSKRQDVADIRSDVTKLVNEFLRLLDPYLSFYEANKRPYRLAFIGWSLQVTDFNYFSRYDDRLKPFRSGVFDFGPLPIWSKATHWRFPWPFRQQVRTFLLMKVRQGSIVNQLFHTDLSVMLFQYMAFNALIVEEEQTKEQYYSTINRSHEENENYSIIMKSSRKRQRQSE